MDFQLHQTMGGSACVTGFTLYTVSNTALTIADINAAAAYLITNFMPIMDVLQSDYVYTDHIHIQARGTAVPANDYVYGQYAAKAVPVANVMPPEFNYWIRWFTADTIDSITGDPDTAHPVRRGGAFIVGADDTYLSGGSFAVPAGDEPEWAALLEFMTDTHTINGRDYTGGVLGEEIVSGTGWRIAAINGMLVKRITRLRSRAA